MDLAEVAGGATIRCDLRLRHFGVAHDRADDIVEVVRYAAREGAHRFHATGMLKLRLQTLSFLLHDLPADGVGNDVESRRQQAELARSRDTAGAAHRIEAQDHADAASHCA